VGMNKHRSLAAPPFYLLLFSLALCPLVFLPVLHSFTVPRLAFTEIIITIFLAASAGRLAPRKSPIFIPFVLFSVLCFLSIFRTDHFFMGWKTFYMFFLFSGLAVALTVLPGARGRFRAVLIAVLIPGAINAVYAIVQFFWGDFSFMETSKFQAFGTIGSPGRLAGYLALCLPAAAHLYSGAKGKITGRLLVATGIICAFSIALTQSRSGAAAAVSALLIYVTLSYFAGVRDTGARRRMVAAAVFFLVMLSILAVGPETIQQKTRNKRKTPAFFVEKAKSGSVTQRLLIWESALEMIKSEPLAGYGIGSFASSYPCGQMKVLSSPEKFSRYKDIVGKRIATYAHNDYLQIAASTGIPGLLVFLLFPVFGFRTFLRGLCGGDDFARLHGPCAAAAVTAVGVQALLDFPLFMPETALFGWLMLGYMASSATNQRACGESRPVRFAVAVAAGIFCFAAACPLVSVIHLEMARSALARNDLSLAEKHLNTAYGFDPSEPEIPFEEARVKRSEGNFSRSVYYCEEALRLSCNPKYSYCAGISRYLMGDIDNAESAFEHILRRYISRDRPARSRGREFRENAALRPRKQKGPGTAR